MHPAAASTILVRDADRLFTIFVRDGQHYLTAVAGTTAWYGLTIRLSEEEAGALSGNRGHAARLVRSLAQSPDSFEDRRVRPSLDP